MVLEHPPRSALSPPITSSRISTQPTATVGVEERGGRGTTSSRTTTGAAPELRPPKSACAGDVVLAPAPGAPSPWDSALGAIEDSISQCTFLQMTYTPENPHADGSAAPGARPRLRPTCLRDPHATSPAPTTTGWREDRCPVVNKRPLHSRAAPKMSPRIRIGPAGARPGRPCPVPACSGQPLPGKRRL
jgi:hypothetical protein